MVAFTRLVRFKASDGQIYYGEAGSEWEADLKGKSIPVFTGLDPWSDEFQLSGNSAVVSEVSEQTPPAVLTRLTVSRFFALSRRCRSCLGLA